MKTICINDNYSKENKRPEAKFVINRPILNQIYTIIAEKRGGYIIQECINMIGNKIIPFKKERFKVLTDLEVADIVLENTNSIINN